MRMFLHCADASDESAKQNRNRQAIRIRFRFRMISLLQIFLERMHFDVTAFVVEKTLFKRDFGGLELLSFDISPRVIELAVPTLLRFLNGDDALASHVVFASPRAVAAFVALVVFKLKAYEHQLVRLRVIAIAKRNAVGVVAAAVIFIHRKHAAFYPDIEL